MKEHDLSNIGSKGCWLLTKVVVSHLLWKHTAIYVLLCTYTLHGRLYKQLGDTNLLLLVRLPPSSLKCIGMQGSDLHNI